MRQKGLAGIEQISEFDTIIDARSPGDFAEDRVPGAINLPVLSDAERIRVGTLYKQVSIFEAKKLGAALVARNIAHAIETSMLDKPKDWRPLVYCWRGGQRSGAFCHILREIGWNAHRLEGGYKTWRAHVLAQLAQLPGHFRFHVISGATGSGKSRLLETLGRRGAQVLHLEQLAAHKGSVLGGLPGQAQPQQKGFDSLLFAELIRFDPARPLFVEAESRKIGQLHLPDALITALRSAPCLRINATLPARVNFLLHDYDYAIADPTWLLDRLNCLNGLQSKETLAHWQALIAAGAFPQLVEALLKNHYDPLYQRSQSGNYRDYSVATQFATDDLSPSGIDALADAILTTTGS
jgi:tRNA 2-selenouridine synthase